MERRRTGWVRVLLALAVWLISVGVASWLLLSPDDAGRPAAGEPAQPMGDR